MCLSGPKLGYKLIETSDGRIFLNDETVIEGQGLFIDNLGGIKSGWNDGDQTSLTTENLEWRRVVNANAKTLSETFLGSLAFVSQGAEFIADEGIRQMALQAKPGAVSAFGAVQVGSSRYKTGSHVSVDGASLATGIVAQFDDLMLAGFIEAGWADSESHVGSARGDGDHDYYGVGAALRWRFHAPFYAEGSVRIGQASTDFSVRYNSGRSAYDTDSLYASAHVGLGTAFPLSEALHTEIYGRYVVTYLDGKTATLSSPDREKLDMDNAAVHSLRIGARLLGEFCPQAAWHFGLAYERVLNGDAEAELIGQGAAARLDTPSLEGHVGIAEVGLRLTPDAASPWRIDLGVKGYVGNREGVNGSCTVQYLF